MAEYTISKIKLPNGDICNIKNTITGVKGDAESTYRTGNVNLTAANIGLGNVNNTSDATKQIYEANLLWGGKNFAASYGPIDAAIIDELGANRLMFIKGEAITIEYSRDNGSTWTDYGATNVQKTALFSNGQDFLIGKADSTNKATANGTKYQLRVTINTGVGGIYTVLNKIVIYVSTNGSSNCTVTIQKALQSAPDNYTDHVTNIPIGGWSGYNIINFSGLTTYGNTANSQYGRVRFIFKADGGNTNYAGLAIAKIMGFGGVGWGTPSTMAKTGHLYSFDALQNATFPAGVTATSFSGPLTGNVTGNVSGTAANVTGTIAIEHGGTNATTVAGARTNLGLGSIAVKADTDYIKFLGNLTSLGSGTPASSAQTYWTDNINTNSINIAYNTSGVEYSLIFSKGGSNNVGSILKWSYTDKYLCILRQQNGWKSDDWEKISAGYADSAGSAGSVALSGVTGADDLKAIEALSGTSGFLKKTAANTWTLDTNTYLTSSTGVTSIAGKTGAVTLADLGLSNAMHFLGVTTTNVSSGTPNTTATVSIGDSNVTAAAGDVVLYYSQEYVWGNNKWNLLGDESSYKVKQTAQSDPTASTTTSTTFIDTISQNTNGVITATKKTLPTASTTVAGITKVGASDGAATYGHTHTLSLATDSGTSSISLAANTKYKLTAGGSTYVFTTPSDTNTWRGIQDNLTSSTNTTESLSAKQGYLLANGSARDSTKVSKITSTDNAVVRFNGTNGEVQNSGIIIDDNNNITIPGSLIKFTGLGEGLELTTNNNYFGTNSDARIISMIDSNPGTGSTAVDGGIIIQAVGRVSEVDTVQELLCIRNHNGSSDWKAGEFLWKTKDIVVETGTSKAWNISINGNAVTATTATNLAAKPSLATSGTTQITVTAGGKTSDAYTVPYATIANYPNGFTSRSATASWGNTTGTCVTSWNGGDGCEMAFFKNNPASGQLSMKIDGTIYIKEGGQNIAEAVKSFSISGQTVTYTNLWGGTGTFTTQDTKNTAGSTNSNSKLYLIGATTRAANPTTNSYQYTYTNNGLLSALKVGLNLNGTEKAHLEWNNTDQSIDFIFE